MIGGEFEAVGDAVTGGLLARAVEPSAGEARDGHTQEKDCLNCGTRLSGAYCAACGQKAHIHRSVRAFFQDFVQGLFNFEGKFWRTLPMLAWQPGVITRRYIAGERARFISPVALYLFTVFLMFAALNFTGALTPDTKHLQEGLKVEMAESRKALAELEAKRTADLAAGKNVARLDRKIASSKEDIADIQKAISGHPMIVGDPNGAPSWIAPFIENALENPEMASMKVQDAASKYSWLLIPLSVPFMWLLFPLRRRYNSYDHAVFVTYSLSFMMLLVVTSSIMVAIGLSSIAGLLFFVPPFHMYRQLKGAYELGRWAALWRTALLTLFAFIAISLFASLLVGMGTYE